MSLSSSLLVIFAASVGTAQSRRERPERMEFCVTILTGSESPKQKRRKWMSSGRAAGDAVMAAFGASTATSEDATSRRDRSTAPTLAFKVGPVKILGFCGGPFIARMGSEPSSCPLPAGQLDSLIVSSLPPLFDEFREKRFVLLWRGSRDGFRARDFHGRCDGRANTLMLILDTDGNVFGGFTPLQWESREYDDRYWMNCWKCDDSLKSFLFALKNPHNIPARKFALDAERKQFAICCVSSYGPSFCGMYVYENCKSITDSFTRLGWPYANDTGLDGETVFTGSRHFRVREIEVFEITC
jgi:hypothetical protein